MTSKIAKLLKKWIIIWFLCLMWNLLIGGNLVGHQEVYAADDKTTIQDEFEKVRGLEDAVIRLSNVILRPALMVAGWAMDNSLIMWEVFWFDVALWNLRNLTKNIANFLLAFLFIYNIGLLLKWGKIQSEIIKLLKKVLIAGVLIQASRFVSLAAIDISTIATYGIWGLPITSLSQMQNGSDSKLNIVVFKQEVIIDLQQNQEKDFTILHSRTKKISPCSTIRRWSSSQPEIYVADREIALYQSSYDDKRYLTETNMCHNWWEIYRFTTSSRVASIWWDDATNAKNQQDYKNTLLKRQEGLSWDALATAKSAGQIILITDIVSQVSNLEKDTAWGWNIGRDINNQRMKDAGEASGFYLSEILKEGSYVWAMTSMYGSLLWADWLSLNIDPNNSSDTFVNLLNTSVSLLYRIALVIPIVALAVVLIVRILILRVILAMSPIWVVLLVFDYIEKIKIDVIKNYFSLKEVIMLLLTPVFVTFAVSLSTVFVSLIMELNKTSNPFSEMTGINFSDIIQITIKDWSINFWKLIVSLMWIAVVWAILFWAIKMSAVWKSIWWRMQSATESYLKRIPIVPLPWWWGSVWIEAAMTIPSRIWDDINQKTQAMMYSNAEGSIFENLFENEIKSWKAQVENINQKALSRMTFGEAEYQNIINSVWKNQKVEINGKAFETSDVISHLDTKNDTSFMQAFEKTVEANNKITPPPTGDQKLINDRIKAEYLKTLKSQALKETDKIKTEAILAKYLAAGWTWSLESDFKPNIDTRTIDNKTYIVDWDRAALVEKPVN